MRLSGEIDEGRLLSRESVHSRLTAGCDPSTLNMRKERPVSSIENARTGLAIGCGEKMRGGIVSPLGQGEIEQLDEDFSEVAAHPLIEDLGEERAPLFRAEGPMPGDDVDDGNELDEARPNLIAEEVIEVQRATDIVRMDRCKHTELDAVRFHQSRGADDGVGLEAAPRQRDVGNISYAMSGFNRTFIDPARLNRPHDLLAAEEHWLCHGISRDELNVARMLRQGVTTGCDLTSEMLSVHT